MTLRSSLFFLLFCCSALLAAAANSGPSDIFNEQDANAVQQLILKAQKQDGSFSDIKTAHHAVSALAQLKVDVPKKTEVCNQAKKVLADSKPTVGDVYHAASVAQQLNCAEKASAPVTSVIEAALASDNLYDIYHAVLAINTLKQHITIAKEKQVAAADTVKDLLDADGSVLPHKGAASGDVYNTGLAFQLLGVLHSTVTLPEDTVEGLGDNWVESVLSLGEETDETLTFATKDRLPLEVTATVLRGFLNLHAAKLLDLTKEQVVQFAEFFVRNKSPADVDSAYYLVSGLNLLAKNDQYVPLVLTLATRSISSAAKGAEGNLKVRVTDVIGGSAGNVKVTLTKAAAANDIKALFSNQELTPETTAAGNTVYVLNFLGSKPEPGLYDLDFKVTAPNKNLVQIDSVVESVAVTTTAIPHQLEIAVSDSKDEDDVPEAEKQKLEHPETLKKKLTASDSQHIHISFKVKNGVTGRPFAPQQVFVKLTNTKDNTEAILLPKFVTKKYKLAVDLANVEDFRGASGDYSVEVIVADPAITNPTAWNIGSIRIAFQAAAARPRTPWHAPLPSIEHAFRPDEKRAPATISTVFTGLVFAPVLILLTLVGRVGINFKNFPTGTASLYALAFTGCLFAYAGLVALFWFQINLLTTLKYLAVLGAVTVFVGNRTLQYLAAVRSKRQ